MRNLKTDEYPGVVDLLQVPPETRGESSTRNTILYGRFDQCSLIKLLYWYSGFQKLMEINKTKKCTDPTST